MWQVVDPASGALSVDQATDRSTPPRSSQWAVEKPWCQRHLPRRRKPQGCDPLADTEWCRNSGRNEIESGSRCRHRVRRSSAPHRAHLLFRKSCAEMESGTGAALARLTGHRYTRSDSPMVITRSEPQWHCPVRSTGILLFRSSSQFGRSHRLRSSHFERRCSGCHCTHEGWSQDVL